ncbi:copper amine oxidase N-terminal domain-containing protein [Alkalicoccus urumqiensis]|uniref:Copper amine oxidase n=1 Tax=Alkalicoccus urumqiensis TaxID=1548213 RepID=A0A2P6MLP8_ALKUR|nr:copper amine oxidase N-terminal domain-containing protein [Alkalicoccus urumqiensis]PRO67214.1 copper amine oxidase [Alkalicoccus urumqiensis]
MKYWLAVLIVLFCGVAGWTTSAEAEEDRVIIENGKIEEGRVLMPLRAVVEGGGGEITWDQGTRTVTIEYRDTTIELPINSRTARVNGESVSLDVPARVERGTTFIPLRFFGETLNRPFLWRQQTKTAWIFFGETRVEVHQGTFAPDRLSTEQKESYARLIGDVNRLDDFSQIRSHFRPYFSHELINQIIRQDGYVFENVYPTEELDITYETTTQARFSVRAELRDQDYFTASFRGSMRYENGRWVIVELQDNVSLYP